MSEGADTVRAGDAMASEDERGPSARRQRDRHHRMVAATIAVVVVLALATVLTFRHLPRYDLPGRSILTNGDFHDGFAGWQIEGLVSLDETEVGRAVLQNRNQQGSVYLRRALRLPPGPTSLRLAADVATDRVDRGTEPWQTARVHLVERSPDGDYLWDQSQELVGLVGSTSRQHYERIFAIPDRLSEVMLGIELPHATGSLEIAALEVAVVEERPMFRLVAALVVCGWSLVAFWVVTGIYGTLRSPALRGWLLATLAVALVGALVPERVRQQALGVVVDGLGLTHADPVAFGHTMLFGSLAFLIRLGRPRDPILVHLACWLVLGAVVEILQLLTTAGAPDVGDWLAAAVGAVLGVGLGDIALHVRRWIELRWPNYQRSD